MVVRCALVVALALASCERGEPVYPSSGGAITVGDLRADDQRFDGQAVRLYQRVVLAEDTFDETASGNTGNVYIVDPGNEPEHGMQIFAAQVQLPPYQSLRPGDLVDVAGPFVRFTGPPGSSPFEGRVLDQMSFGTVVKRVGQWIGPEPIELSVVDYLRSPAMYVGSLITLRGLTATGSYELATSSSGSQRLDPFGTAEGMAVSAEMYRIPGVVAGTRLARITGVASYFYDDFLMPRDASDVEVEAAPMDDAGVHDDAGSDVVDAGE